MAKNNFDILTVLMMQFVLYESKMYQNTKNIFSSYYPSPQGAKPATPPKIGLFFNYVNTEHIWHMKCDVICINLH